MCAESSDAQEVMLYLVRQDPRIAFKALFFTFNPKNAPGYRHMPFITWPIQDEMVMLLQDAIVNGYDLLIDKSRDEGASWLNLGVFFYNWLFVPDSQFLVGSRKIELVDKMGDRKCLFWKLGYLLEHLPKWLAPEFAKKFCHLENLHNGSSIDGESTTENFAAGDRRTAVLLDELARVDPNIAQGILDAASDVTDCRVINSTHTTAVHPYCKLRRGITAKVKVFVLPWWKDPRKNDGLYQSPDYSMVILHDIKYWRNRFSGIFDEIHEGIPFNTKDVEVEAVLSGEESALFVADGSGQWRSPWFDKEERRRSARDVAQNLMMNPIGSGDMVFDGSVLQQIRTDLCRKPDYSGEIEYKYFSEYRGESEYVKVSEIRFVEESGKCRLSWWGELLEDNKPNQTHNYVIGCDIALGTGASNSVASIFDVNTCEKVGSWVCAFTSPVNFANQVYALAKWTGGFAAPFLIWESNGGQGGAFARQLFKLGYGFYYKKRDEKKVSRPRTNNPGWHNSAQTKVDLLLSFRESLSWTFKTSVEAHKFIIYDETAVGEYEEYLFDKTGRPNPDAAAEEEGGARAAHGDRCIADALCDLGRKEQPAVLLTQPKVIQFNSAEYRRMLYEQRQSNESNESRWVE